MNVQHSFQFQAARQRYFAASVLQSYFSFSELQKSGQ
jgi:hypothetical protein